MPDVIIFGEDYAHEIILRTLLERLAAIFKVPVKIRVRSATGGHGRLLGDLKEFVRELAKGQAELPDLFVVARDANCLGYAQRAKEITETLEHYRGSVALAVPDPHVERWLLLDSHAFKVVLKQGCQAPDRKC